MIYLGLYLLGYAVGVWVAVVRIRHELADPDPYGLVIEAKNGDFGLALLVGLGVLCIPLIWPILAIGFAGWHLVTRKKEPVS